MLTCRELTELVTDRLEGKLSVLDTIRFEMHVGLCRACRAYLQQMKVTLETLGRLPAEPVPEDVLAEMVLRFRRWRKTG